MIVFFVTNFKSNVEVFLEFSSFKLNKFSYKEALSFKCEIICSTKDSLNFEKSWQVWFIYSLDILDSSFICLITSYISSS